MLQLLGRNTAELLPYGRENKKADFKDPLLLFFCCRISFDLLYFFKLLNNFPDSLRLARL